MVKNLSMIVSMIKKKQTAEKVLSLLFLLSVFAINAFLSSDVYASGSSTRECPGSDGQCPQITDINLQQCIEETVRKPFDSLTEDDFLSITALNCSNKGIENISGIENLPRLVELGLDNNRIRDLGPIVSLHSLTRLYLWNNWVADISPVSRLIKIKELHLVDNQVEDITPLKRLSKLEELLIGGNAITEVGSLQNLRKLIWLDMPDNQISNLLPIANLTRLQYLDVSGNNVNDIHALKELVALTRLNLQNNNIIDIEPLSNLNAVWSLNLGNNKIADITSLSSLLNLKSLDLQSNLISDISVLKKLTSLRRVVLDNNLVRDISPLAHLPKLNDLIIDNNLVSDLAPLAGLANLDKVSFLNNCIMNRGPVSQAVDAKGMEYQHNLCNSPKLVRKKLTIDWLDSRIAEQCEKHIDDGPPSSLKVDYEYYPDGIFTMFYVRDDNGQPIRKLVCRLTWNSRIEEFLNRIEHTELPPGKYEIYKFNTNHIYVKEGMIKGYSLDARKKTNGDFTILNDIAHWFGVNYKLERQKEGSEPVYTAVEKGHVIRVTDRGDTYSLDFFEDDFFEEEINR